MPKFKLTQIHVVRIRLQRLDGEHGGKTIQKDIPGPGLDPKFALKIAGVIAASLANKHAHTVRCVKDWFEIEVEEERDADA